MALNNTALQPDQPDILTIGRRTREIIVGPQACPSLSLYGIGLTGVSHCDDEFCFVRHRSDIAQLLVAFDGAGEVLVDGVWQRCTAGSAYLTPTGALHAYHSVPNATSESGANWVVCWVLYNGGTHAPPDVGVDEPALLEVDGAALRNAIENLYQEAMGLAEPAILQSWASLVYSYAQRVISPTSRLSAVWKAVGADLAFPWSLSDLSDIVGVTPEQVRRLCQRELGCSPMHYVTELRMRAAASLLSAEFYTIEAVAERVGYENAFAFSTAFKRRMGITPSDFRRPPVTST